LTLSLLVVYLHNVRRVSITFATILLALTAIAGLAISPLSGTLVDRVGPVAVVVPMFLGEAGSLMLRAFARHKPQIIVAALLLAFFGGEAWGWPVPWRRRLRPSSSASTGATTGRSSWAAPRCAGRF
jgi:predicted MFS family arabinose efflux permease